MVTAGSIESAAVAMISAGPQSLPISLGVSSPSVLRACPAGQASRRFGQRVVTEGCQPAIKNGEQRQQGDGQDDGRFDCGGPSTSVR